jgi:hypothetical protein
LAVVARLLLAAVLAGAALAKLAAPRSSRAALATFGAPGGGWGWALWAAVVAAEATLAAGVAAGIDLAAWTAAGLLGGFAVALGLALRRGRAGAPCACFGSRSTVSRSAVTRNIVLAAAFAALPFVPTMPLGLQGWLAVGVAVALAGIGALTIVVLALAREVGMLRLQLAPQAALEISGEGPTIGSQLPLIDRFTLGSETRLALAVFSSDGCRLCRALEPALSLLGRDPVLAVEVFDEQRDAPVWRELAIPGSPFAVTLDREGVVRAKGTFNTFAQLEGILAAAERRERAGSGA